MKRDLAPRRSCLPRPASQSIGAFSRLGTRRLLDGVDRMCDADERKLGRRRGPSLPAQVAAGAPCHHPTAVTASGRTPCDNKRPPGRRGRKRYPAGCNSHTSGRRAEGASRGAHGDQSVAERIRVYPGWHIPSFPCCGVRGAFRWPNMLPDRVTVLLLLLTFLVICVIACAQQVHG